MICKRDFEVVVVATFLVGSCLLGIFGFLVLFVNRILHVPHVGVRQSSKAENAERIASLVDFSYTNLCLQLVAETGVWFVFSRLWMG